MTVVMDAEQMNAFLQTVFVEVAGEFHVEEVSDTGVIMRLIVQDRH